MAQKKLILDITMGAVVPLLLLSYGDKVMEPRWTFVLAGLIPALYVVWDILFYSKRFNALTTIIGASAVAQGGLAFLKVDGWKYAMADTGNTVVTFLLFGLTLVTGRPILQYFMVQVLQPENGYEEGLTWKLLRAKPVYRAMVLGTVVILAEHVLRGVFNYYYDLAKVTALFGTEEFNLQKRNVEGLTRFLYPVTALGSMAIAYMMVGKAIDDWLGKAANDGGTLFEQVERKMKMEEKTPAAVKTEPLGEVAKV